MVPGGHEKILCPGLFYENFCALFYIYRQQKKKLKYYKPLPDVYIF